METLHSVRSFDVEFLLDLYVMSSPESKNVFFEKLVFAYVCVYVYVGEYMGNIQHFLHSKLIKVETSNFKNNTR